MSINNMSIKNHLDKGKQALKDKNYELAIRNFDIVLVKYPNHNEAKLKIRKFFKKTNFIKQIESSEKNKTKLVKEEILKKNFAIAKHQILYILRKSKQETQLINYLAQCETELGNIKEAINVYENFLKHDNRNIATKLNLANLYLTLGITEKAQKLYLSIIQQDPFETDAHRLLVSTKRQISINDPHTIQMQSLFSKKNTSIDLKINLGFALGNTFETLKDFNKSYYYYKTSNELQHQSINFDLNKEKFFIKKIVQNFNLEKVSYLKEFGSNDKRPVFIVGMPRSGTSLVEQILSSHPKIYGAGELSFIEDYLYKNRGVMGLRIPTLINEPNPERLKNFSNYYINQLDLINVCNRYIIDKMPGNFRWVGLLKSAFPHSKIIHVTRNPMDNCFSILKSFFANQTCGYSYHQKTLGEYYNVYKKTFKNWINIFGDEIYNCVYEELVRNPETVVKEMITYLNLDWDNQVLKFYENTRRVNTISALQVREKTYTKSINSWKNYRKNLTELYKTINKNLV